MDRCRCADNEEAVRKLKFYTVGTLRPDIIDNYDRSNYNICWVRSSITPFAPTFERARATRLRPAYADPLSPRARMVEQMWCKAMENKRKI